MADAPGNAITAAFPAPPPFYNSFTRENLTRLQDLREAAVAAGSQELVAKDVPEELQHLIPPEPPTAPYRSFGELHEPIPFVSPAGAPQPLTSHALVSHLTNLTHRLLLHFLSLVTALSTDPAGYAPIWDRLHANFAEIHAALNAYRPHAAREALIVMMEEEIKKRREGTRFGREGVEKMKEVLLGLEGKVHDQAREDTGVFDRVDDLSNEKRMWEVLWREVDDLPGDSANGMVNS